MRETITTCGELVGAALISMAAFLVSPALGLLTTGVAVAGISWLAS